LEAYPFRVSRLAIFIASSMRDRSTAETGLKAEILRLLEERDMRWLEREVCDERPDATDEEGDLDRGVDMSELVAVLLLL
jgi:hypothetical protein